MPVYNDAYYDGRESYYKYDDLADAQRENPKCVGVVFNPASLEHYPFDFARGFMDAEHDDFLHDQEWKESQQ